MHLRGQLGAAPDEVGLSEAGAQVVSGGDAFFHRCRVVGPGDLLCDLAPCDLGAEGSHHGKDDEPDQGEQHPGRPPGQSGHDIHREGPEQGAREVPDHAPQEHSELVRVIVDPVEDLSDRRLRQDGERLVQRRGQQIGTQPSLCPVDHGGPDGATSGVEQGTTHQAERQQLREAGGRSFRQPARDDGAAGLAKSREGRRRESPTHRPAPQPFPPERAGRVGRRFGCGAHRALGVDAGHGHGSSTLRGRSVNGPWIFGCPASWAGNPDAVAKSFSCAFALPLPWQP